MSSSRRPSVLLIGADRYVMRACERRGIDAVVLCPPATRDTGRAQIPPSMTTLLIEDYCNPEDMFMALRRAGLAGHTFDGVQTTNEASVVVAAMLGQVLGCPAMAPDTAALFRDKSLQKDRLRAAGVPVAPATVIEDIRDVSGVPFDYERAVLKPIAGGGTRVTSIVDSAEELRQRSREYAQMRTPQRTFVLEAFVPGDEWVADGVVFGGEVMFFGLATYGQPCITAITEQVPLLMRRLDPHTQAWAYAAAEPVVRGAIAALGMVDGVFHMELFYDSTTSRTLFGECGARRGGALTQEENHSKFNVDMGDAALMCALGRRPELDVKVRPQEVACVFLPSRAGTLFSYPSRAETLAQPNVEFVRMQLPFGTQTTSSFTDSVERVGAVLLAVDGLDQLFRRVDEVRRWFDERMVVSPERATTGERWAWQREHWPHVDAGDPLYGGP